MIIDILNRPTHLESHVNLYGQRTRILRNDAELPDGRTKIRGLTRRGTRS